MQTETINENRKYHNLMCRVKRKRNVSIYLSMKASGVALCDLRAESWQA